MVGQAAEIVKGLNLSNILIIALLLGLGLPTFVIWRMMNDASLLNKFTSFYEELSSDKVSCTLRVGSQRGADPMYSLTTGFAIQGSDRYTVGVTLKDRPDDAELVSYCATLDLIVDFMRRPNAKPPTYPGSEEPLIWQYPPSEDVP
jgi:hypothetical protein